MANTKITADNIAANAITASSITDGTITAAKLAANSVDSDQYVDGSIDLIHMSVNSIDSDQYVDGSIDTIHIADGAITSAKLDTNIAIAGTLGVTGDITGTLATAAQPNITSVGTLSALTVTGEITANGGIALGDNDIATFGASDDLKIYHDGSHSYVSDAGAGQLRLKGDTVAITNQLNTEYLALFNEDSDVKLYYNSEQKLATTSTGIDVTGTATINSGTNGTTAALLFKTTDNVDVSKYIRMSSYYMEYSGNSNEGHHFIDSNSASLLKVFGSTHSSYPRRIGMGTETPAGKLHIATGLEPNNVYITTGASGGTGYDVTLNMLGGANNSEMVINLGIDGDADKNQIKSYQGNLYTRVNNSQRAEINAAGKHTWWGTHQGDGVGHFLFTNQGFDTSDVNCSLVVQNGQTFLQVMAWASHGARIGTRIGGWSATGSQGTYLVAADATNIICTSGGSPTLSNGTGITSDERLKENITDIEDGQLAKIIALRPRNFTWKDSRKSGNMEGFIAQEVESIIPEAVEEREVAPDPTDTSRDFEGDVKVIKHEVLNARLIKAIQEQQALIESLTTRLETLENA